MINANLSQFLDTGWFNEATLYYNGFIYWCEGNWDKTKQMQMHFFVYRFPVKIVDKVYFERIHTDESFEYLFEVWGFNEGDVKNKFLNAKIFEGKSFWEVENSLMRLDE